MIDGKLVYAIIPARGGSKRLPRKNITPIWGKPMLYWAIRACKNSIYTDDCFVSTEDTEITKVASQFGAKVIRRPKHLAADLVYKQYVIVHAAKIFKPKPGIVISLQPNSPEICSRELDEALEKLIQFNRNEIFTVDADLLQNAAFRVMRYEYVFQPSLSTYCGVVVTGYKDVHSREDLDVLEKSSHPCEHVWQKEGTHV